MLLPSSASVTLKGKGVVKGQLGNAAVPFGNRRGKFLKFFLELHLRFTAVEFKGVIFPKMKKKSMRWIVFDSSPVQDLSSSIRFGRVAIGTDVAQGVSVN